MTTALEIPQFSGFAPWDIATHGMGTPDCGGRVVAEVYRRHGWPVPQNAMLSLHDWQQEERLFTEYPRPIGAGCTPLGVTDHTWWLGHQTTGSAAPGPALNLRPRRQRGIVIRFFSFIREARS